MVALAQTKFPKQEGRFTKRGHQRSKLGCLTCRNRRVKCDENRPVCQRCSKAHHNCFWANTSGDRFRFDSLADYENGDNSAKILPVLRALNIYQSYVGGPAEVRSFQFFIEEASLTASAYFGYSFWTHTVPQMCWSSAVLKHAAIAFSALVEKYNTDSDQIITTKVYVSCWQNAIRGATLLIDESKTEDILVLCLLLTLCNFMEADFESGYQHIKSGMNIIAQYFSTPSIQRPHLELIKYLGSIFVSFACKAPTYGCELVWPSNFPRTIQRSDEPPYVPRTFSSLAHAEHCQSGLAHTILQLRRRPSSGQDLRPLWQNIENILESWDRALSVWEKSIDQNSRTKLGSSILLLKTYATVLSIITDEASGKKGYERNSERFQFITTSMRTICNLTDENIAQWFYQQGQIDGHTGYIPPLFFTAITCPDQRIKKDARDLLASIRVEEGAWTSCIAAAVANKISLIEVQLQHTVKSVTDRPLITVEGLRTKPASKKWLLDYTVKTNTFFSPIHVSSELELCTCAQKLNLQPSCGIIKNLGFQGERMSQPSSCAKLFESAIQSTRRQNLLPRTIILEEADEFQ